jgi:hypothetical protein
MALVELLALVAVVGDVKVVFSIGQWIYERLAHRG